MGVTVHERSAEQSEGQPAGGRGWVAGPVAALLVLGSTLYSGVGFSVTDDKPVPQMLAELEAARGALLLGGGAQALSAFALVVFGAWLAVRLAALEPQGALTSRIAGGGCLLAAALAGMGAAVTQLATLAAEETADPAINLTLHALEENLFAGAWCAIALPAAAVAVAALRHRVLPTWFGAVSAFVVVLLVVLQVVLPWAGWFPALIWLVVAGSGLRRAGARSA